MKQFISCSFIILGVISIVAVARPLSNACVCHHTHADAQERMRVCRLVIRSQISRLFDGQQLQLMQPRTD